MRQFTAYQSISRDRILAPRPTPTTPTKKSYPRPAHKLANKSVESLRKDCANFTPQQRLQGASILAVLEIAEAHHLRVPEIDEICQAAKTHFARSKGGQFVSIKNLRVIFRMLVKHGYIKKG